MKTKKAAAVTAAGNIKLQSKAYRKDTSMSSDNLKEQIGLLLWFLCCPINQRQIVAGYKLLEIMLSARYERGAL